MSESDDAGEELGRERALQLLKAGSEGVAEWNRVRGQGRGLPSLSEADLSGASLASVDLSGVDLTHANLCGADLFEANLDGADLSEADLTSAHLSDASLVDANLIEATLSSANLMGADLGKARLSYADLLQANLIGADLTATVLNRASFARAQLVGAHLASAKLSGTDFRHADLRGAELSEAEFSEADLKFANLSKANLSRALLDSTELAGAHFDGANLDAAVLTHVELGPDHDLLVADWEHLGINGTSYTREAVERGAQRLPPGRPPLSVRFPTKSALDSQDLSTLGRIGVLGPRGTRLFLELGVSGQMLTVEGRGDLPNASLIAALLFVLPAIRENERRSAEYLQTSQLGDAEGATLLRTLVAESSTTDLVACAGKLAAPTLYARNDDEGERFRQTLESCRAAGDVVVFENEIRVERRSAEVERSLLEALGLGGFFAEPSARQGKTA